MPAAIHTPSTQQEWLALRANDITSTEVSALFGCSPYMTAFELWHSKRDRTYSALTPNERMQWGTRLQNSIAAGVAEEQGWTIKPLGLTYLRLADLRIGSSFDFSWIAKDATKGLLEVKNVDTLAFRDGWIESEDGSLEAPLHIEMQVQHEMLVSGHTVCYIGALVGGNKLVLIRREADLSVHEAIKAKVAMFWASVDANQPPEPDFARDAEFISKMYGFASPNKVMAAQGNVRILELANAYKLAGDEAKSASERKDAAKAELLTLIGDAEKVIGNTFKISATVIGPTRIEYDRKGYRDFRINWTKQK